MWSWMWEDGALVERARIGQWDDPEHDLLSDGTVLSGAYVANRRTIPPGPPGPRPH